MWRDHQDPNKIIGLRFGDKTLYGIIDIDAGSPYHPAENFSGFKDVLAALEEIGLCRPAIQQSSDSEGIHIYYFLPELLPTFWLANAIKFALEDTGLQLRCGQLESFPNVKAYSKHGKSLYNGCRLPLQAGSYLLDDDAQRISDDLTQFLDAADVAAANQDLTALKKALAAAKKRFKRRFTSSTSTDTDRRKREIKDLIAQGWTGHHQTNNLLIKIANDAIFWEDLHGEALVNCIVETAIALPGYKQYCRHQHEIRKRAAEVAKMADGYWTRYCSYPERSGRSYEATFNQQGQQNNIVEFSPPNRANIQRSQQAAERIQQAVDHLKATNMLFAGATARAAAIIATVKELTNEGISLRTLHKPFHLPLWHPGHQETPEPAQGEVFYPVLDTDLDQETPEPAQGEVFYPVFPNEVSVCEVCLSETPQRVSEEVEEVFVLVQEEEREEEVLATIPISAPATAIKFPMVDNPADSIRLGREFVAAKVSAAKSVKSLEQDEGRRFSDEERSRCLEIATYRFLWESNDPLWMDEVREWFATNPRSLSEPPFTITSTDGAQAWMDFHFQPVENLPETLPQPAELLSESPQFKVGDHVHFEDCPVYCSWMNPFTVSDIEDGKAWLAYYFEPVAMFKLTKWIDCS